MVLMGACLAAGPAVAGAQRAYAASAASTGAAGGVLTAITPQRVLDTRTTLGGHHGVLGAYQTMTVNVVGIGGVPPAGVAAVLVNVTVVNDAAGGYLALYQSGTTWPGTSTLNFYAGQVTANETLVPVGADGRIAIYDGSAGGTDVVVDAEGWVRDDAGGAAAAAVGIGQPTRVLDTRTTVGGHHAPLTAGQSISVPVQAVGSVPATGVAAVLADIVAVPVGASGGYLTAYPSGSASVPLASNVNFSPGQVVATTSLVPLGPDGALRLYNSSPQANVVIDVVGWVTAGNGAADAGLSALPPVRILDTRTTTGGHPGRLSAGQTIDIRVVGLAGVPSTGAAAVVLHVTAVGATTVGTYFKVFASGYTENNVITNASMLNEPVGVTVSNTIVVPVGANGAVSLYNDAGNPNAVVDVEGWLAAPVLSVTPPLASAFSGGPLTSADGVRATAILRNSTRYAVTTWWSSVAPALLTGPMTNAAASTTGAVRRLSMQAYGLATALATGAYDPADTGVSTATATADAIRVINTVAAGHMVNAPGGWGATWDSDYYAAYAGTAAWMLWPQLAAGTRTSVERMVYFEADWGAGVPLGYYANASGTVIQPGDSASDSDSWAPMAAQLAAAMMPADPEVPIWQFTIVRDGLAAWARPADVSRTALVNGASLAAWINGGSNVLADGSQINHNRVAYDYSTLIYHNVQEALLEAMAGEPAPSATTSLLGPVYQAFTTVSYSSPPYDAPGGTAYVPGSATVYYPQGDDWGTGQELPYALIDAQSAAFGFGQSSSATYEALHANAELAMQKAHSDGHTYDSDAQYNYIGREEHIGQQTAQLFFTIWMRDHALIAFENNSHWLPAN